MILLLAVIIPRKYDVHAVTCLHILHCFKTTVLVSSLVSLLVLVLLMILTTWCREWTNSNIVWLWWLYIQTNRVQLCIACRPTTTCYYISHDTWLSCATCTWFSNSRCAVNMKPRISVLQVSKSVSQSVHLYSAPESRKNVSTVPGGREQVRLQCTYEGVLWQLVDHPRRSVTVLV